MIRGVVTVVILACSAGMACSGDKAHSTDTMVARAPRPAGLWSATLTLEHTLALGTDIRSLPRSVHGTLALLPSSGTRLSFPEMDNPSWYGSYSLRLDTFGLLPITDEALPGVIARVANANGTGVRDSIYIVLNPGSRQPLRMNGTLYTDSVKGNWTDESVMRARGSFVLHRL